MVALEETVGQADRVGLEEAAVEGSNWLYAVNLG
jgi:hypothetical protein